MARPVGDQQVAKAVPFEHIDQVEDGRFGRHRAGGGGHQLRHGQAALPRQALNIPQFRAHLHPFDFESVHAYRSSGVGSRAWHIVASPFAHGIRGTQP